MPVADKAIAVLKTKTRIRRMPVMVVVDTETIAVAAVVAGADAVDAIATITTRWARPIISWNTFATWKRAAAIKSASPFP